MIRRTPQVKEEMDRVLRMAIGMLEHPSAPYLDGQAFMPKEIARFLRTDIDLLSYSGKLQEKEYVLGDLKYAADYLSDPRTANIPLMISPAHVARRLRKMIRDLT